jgi:hypothetical protein
MERSCASVRNCSASIRCDHHKLLPDGTEVMGSPHPGYWGRLTMIIGRAQDGKIIEGTSFPLVGEAVVIGRERGDILFSEDGYVSGTHARFSFRQGRPYLQDLASSNGTYLRIPAERVSRSWYLHAARSAALPPDGSVAQSQSPARQRSSAKRWRRLATR